ncbi:MAG: protein kinase domain-containing protein [Planctomycetales bacterium]
MSQPDKQSDQAARLGAQPDAASSTGEALDPTGRLAAPNADSVAGAPSPRSTVPETLRELGRYRILQRLGQGGMGSVYLAEDTQLRRKVALKIPQIPDDDSGDWLERFYREARAAATIHHSHLCPVYDVGEIDGVHFLTMAYVEGEPLSKRIGAGQCWDVTEAAMLLRKLALAIQVAHDQGIVHRDLKPANIMMNRQGEPVIVDFGLARRADAEDATLTRLGELLGTPAYMSPEQVEGIIDNIGPPSDLYSLGVILFELLTGRRPFQGSVAAVLGKILRDTPPPPSNFRGGLDVRIELICRKLMARQPADRFANGQTLAEALDQYLRTIRLGDDLPTPLREPARTIAPPTEATAGYDLKTQVAAPVSQGSNKKKTAEAAAELCERIAAFLIGGQMTEALLACQSGGASAWKIPERGKLVRQAFTNAINHQLQAREPKQAVKIAAGLHASVLPVDSADLLAKTLSAAGRVLWSDDDPGPALQLWQKLIERFPKTKLLAEKGAVFAYNRGVALEQAGKFSSAIVLYRQAMSYDPRNEVLRKRLATASLNAAANEARARRWPQALAICDEALRALPGHAGLEKLRTQIRVGES